MSRESSKLNKDELREDEFVEWVMSAVDYVRARYQIFAAALVAVVVLILGVDYIIGSQARARVDAAAKLGNALMAEEEGSGQEAMAVLQEVSREYDGTPAAAQATIMLANRYYAQGLYAEARRHYRKYLDDYGQTPMLVYAARSGLAACLEAEGQDLAAAQEYEAIAAENEGTVYAAMALWEAADCYARLGQTARQRELLKRIVEEHAELRLAVEARHKLALL